jgi:sugar (pentulose or hexulose) kinase
VPQTPGALVRCVLESLALAYREVLEQVSAVAHRTLATIHIVGGGTQNKLLNQMTANATGLPVIAGPIEATVIGNALVQLITLGEIADLQQARQVAAGMAELKRYEPIDVAVWDEAYGRYQDLN